MELRGRDLLDPAVQESMLAIPYALARLESVSQAADHYINAIEAFNEETNRIDRTISDIESGRFFDDFVTDEPLDSTGWYWRMEALPEGPQARYLFHLLDHDAAQVKKLMDEFKQTGKLTVSPAKLAQAQGLSGGAVEIIWVKEPVLISFWILGSWPRFTAARAMRATRFSRKNSMRLSGEPWC